MDANDHITDEALAITTDSGGEDTREFLTFMMAGEEYGLDILRVQEIRGWDIVTPIPNTPSYIRGVINLRGSIVPIVDLRARFLLDGIEYDNTTVVIVLKVESENGERIMGIVVDAVSDVYNVNISDVKPPPDFGGVVSIEYVDGLVTVKESMVIILDIDKMLTTEELTGPATAVAA